MVFSSCGLPIEIGLSHKSKDMNLFCKSEPTVYLICLKYRKTKKQNYGKV